jgi:uncharacterized iron-regulated membrane protein
VPKQQSIVLCRRHKTKNKKKKKMKKMKKILKKINIHFKMGMWICVVIVILTMTFMAMVGIYLTYAISRMFRKEVA